MVEPPHQIYSCRTGLRISAARQISSSHRLEFCLLGVPLTSDPTLWILVSENPLSHPGSRHALLPGSHLLPTQCLRHRDRNSLSYFSFAAQQKTTGNVKQHTLGISASAGPESGPGSPESPLRVSQGCHSGVSSRHSFLDLGSSSRLAGCQQNSVPCSCRAEGPTFLLAVARVLARGPLLSLLTNGGFHLPGRWETLSLCNNHGGDAIHHLHCSLLASSQPRAPALRRRGLFKAVSDRQRLLSGASTIFTGLRPSPAPPQLPSHCSDLEYWPKRNRMDVRTREERDGWYREEGEEEAEIQALCSLPAVQSLWHRHWLSKAWRHSKGMTRL